MIYSFGEFELDTRLCELRQASKSKRIEPQVFDVLSYLLQHRDRVVTKQELLEQVWADRFVTEATLSSRLMAARKAVGDSGRSQQVIQTVHGRGFRFVAPVVELPASAAPAPALTQAVSPPADRVSHADGRNGETAPAAGRDISADDAELDIRFARAKNGGHVAYAVLGQGPPLVLVPGWVSHLGEGWKDPSKRYFYRQLARQQTLVMYDKQGTGLSDRSRSDFSLEAEIQDLEAVVDHLRLEPACLFGVSQGGPVSVAYAARHPGKASSLILFGAYCHGDDIASKAIQDSMLSMIEAHWGIGSKMLADFFIPDADPQTAKEFARFQRESATSEMARRLLRLVYDIEVTDLLPRVQAPTLVIHRKGDRVIHFQHGQQLAAGIPRARFAPMEGRIHFPWLGDVEITLEAISDFLQRAAGEPENGVEAAYARPPRVFPSPTRVRTRAVRTVGRDRELQCLQTWLDEALTGKRRIICITGEPGLGKTTLVESFVDRVQETTPLRIGRGQCIEHRGAGEAYMPLLEALGRICREPGGEELTGLLAERAPTWLVQMPGLVDPQRFDDLQRRVLGATRERMLREIVEALEAFTARQPLLLVLEDLHWSDYSTIDLLELVARRREPARLLLLGTYRPADAKTVKHPLHAVTQELRARGHCEELSLEFLSEQAVSEYLGDRLPGVEIPSGLARLLHQRTDGNPFFMVSVVAHWRSQGLLPEKSEHARAPAELNELAKGVPDSLRQMIEQQLDRLSPVQQQVLEAASVAGPEFSAAAVAAASSLRDDDVEALCTDLAREGRFLRLLCTAEWPDGTFSSRFGFIHSLYEEVLYDRTPAGRRSRLHQRLGERLEAGYAGQAREMATELANHFAKGRDAKRAVSYLQSSAEQAMRHSAHQEAIQHLDAAMQLLSNLSPSAEKTQLEFSLQATLGPALVATKGWAAPEVEQAFQRAVVLSEQVPEQCDRIMARLGLATTYEIRGEYERAETTLKQGLQSAAGDGRLLVESHELMACSMFHQGRFSQAVDHAQSGFELYNPQKQYSLLASFGDDPGVACRDWEALSLWFLGYPDRALEKAEEALGLAEDHIYSLANARAQRAYLHQFRREAAQTAQWAQAAVSLAQEQGFPFREASGMVLLGWAVAKKGCYEEGISLLQQGLATCRLLGAELDRPYFLALLAEAYSAADRHEEGLYALAEALATVRSSRTFFYEAEIHRLMGSLLLKAGSRHVYQIEASFQTALEVARRQNAKSLELRAALSLAKLWQRQDRGQEGRQFLEQTCNSFTEGFDTPDLLATRELLAKNAVASLQ